VILGRGHGATCRQRDHHLTFPGGKQRAVEGAPTQLAFPPGTKVVGYVHGASPLSAGPAGDGCRAIRRLPPSIHAGQQHNLLNDHSINQLAWSASQGLLLRPSSFC